MGPPACHRTTCTQLVQPDRVAAVARASPAEKGGAATARRERRCATVAPQSTPDQRRLRAPRERFHRARNQRMCREITGCSVSLGGVRIPVAVPNKSPANGRVFCCPQAPRFGRVHLVSSTRQALRVRVPCHGNRSRRSSATSLKCCLRPLAILSRVGRHRRQTRCWREAMWDREGRARMTLGSFPH